MRRLVMEIFSSLFGVNAVLVPFSNCLFSHPCHWPGEFPERATSQWGSCPALPLQGDSAHGHGGDQLQVHHGWGSQPLAVLTQEFFVVWET